jgi:hypothetical protein
MRKEERDDIVSRIDSALGRSSHLSQRERDFLSQMRSRVAVNRVVTPKQREWLMGILSRPVVMSADMMRIDSLLGHLNLSDSARTFLTSVREHAQRGCVLSLKQVEAVERIEHVVKAPAIQITEEVIRRMTWAAEITTNRTWINKEKSHAWINRVLDTWKVEGSVNERDYAGLCDFFGAAFKYMESYDVRVGTRAEVKQAISSDGARHSGACVVVGRPRVGTGTSSSNFVVDVLMDGGCVAAVECVELRRSIPRKER